MGRIDWIPIAELPEAFKDGREVLIYDSAGAVVVTYDPRTMPEYCWRGTYGDGDASFTPTHFAEINPPSEAAWPPPGYVKPPVMD